MSWLWLCSITVNWCCCQWSNFEKLGMYLFKILHLNVWAWWCRMMCVQSVNTRRLFLLFGEFIWFFFSLCSMKIRLLRGGASRARSVTSQVVLKPILVEYSPGSPQCAYTHTHTHTHTHTQGHILSSSWKIFAYSHVLEFFNKRRDMGHFKEFNVVLILLSFFSSESMSDTYQSDDH